MDCRCLPKSSYHGDVSEQGSERCDIFEECKKGVFGQCVHRMLTAGTHKSVIKGATPQSCPTDTKETLSPKTVKDPMRKE